ncbi:MAG: YkgJ family cysteine cluster protein [Desulforudis sp.]|jgi:Fe-S-cluster containining protein|nr:MAG: YkgJ family cysteine cluster protein [Desulforudis sp.]
MAGGVSVTTIVIQGVNGYDVHVSDPRASVQDYLDVVNKAIEDNQLYRGRAERTDCRGCDLCCQERIPLTSIDVLRLKAQVAPAESLTGFVRTHANVSVDGGAVDITLRLDRQGRCQFLHPDGRTCRVYTSRPLVCQSFICCPQTKRARKLRERIVNVGEDELVRQWLLKNRQLGTQPYIDRCLSAPAIDLRDWSETPFSGKTAYDEVLLREACLPGLWKQVFG